MKRLFLALAALILVMGMALFLAGQTRAQSGPTWTSAILYFNPADVPIETVGCETPGFCDDFNIMYYRSSGDSVPSKPLRIEPLQSGVVLVGSVLFDQTFRGSAVISSTVPLAAMFRQVYNAGDPHSPILYTSLDNTQSGEGFFYLPWVQRTSSFDTEIGIQNIESVPISLIMKLYKRDGSVAASAVVGNVEPQYSHIFRISSILPAGSGNFEGSLVVDADFSGQANTNPRIVAAAREIMGGGNKAYGFEGAGSGQIDWHMVSAACSYGPGQQTTYYSIQNTSPDTSAEAQVIYYSQDGALVGTYPKTGSASIPPGAALLVSGCDETSTGVLKGKYLSAVVHSTNGVGLAVIGKAIGKDGLMTAFNGQLLPAASTDGKYYLALPYLEYASREDGTRSYISVLNVGNNPANDVSIRYYGRDGSLIAVENLTYKPLPGHAKRGTDPSVARAIDPGSYGFFGAATVVSDQPIVALVRVQRGVNLPGGVTVLGEDYIGIPYLKNW